MKNLVCAPPRHFPVSIFSAIGNRVASLAHRHSVVAFSFVTLSFFGLGLLTGHAGLLGDRQDAATVDMRALVLERTSSQLEAARRKSEAFLEFQTVRLIAAMSSRAQESFAPWIYEYGQSVKLDLSRSSALKADHWNLATSTTGSSANLNWNDVALIQARYGEIVATQQHFLNMMGWIQQQARGLYRQDVINRLDRLRAEFNVGVTAAAFGDTKLVSLPPLVSTSQDGGDRAGSSHSAAGLGHADDKAWTDRYFAKLESAVRHDGENLGHTPFNGELIYFDAFLASIPHLTSKAGVEVPPGIATAISAAQTQPAMATSAAALVLTWYVANLDADDMQGIAEVSRMLDVHFESLLDHMLRDPSNGLVARLTTRHSELLEVSQAS